MKLSDTLAQAFNKQVTAEYEASLVYRQLSFLLDDLGLVGMRDWMKLQADEELTHAQMFADHMLNRDAVPQIGAIEAPSLTVNNAVDAFEASLAHEQKISGMIRDLAALTQDERDFDSRPLIDFFLAEQIEEESTVGEILDRLRLIGSDGSGLLRIDAELGARNAE
ncbi:ferritin [Corynebacterium aquilae]|uniref:Ferritin n=1 Tax=Corynebacterium aquilae DSM 44791 TaxID=1431546 RepID=A0A1L7CHM5_9CORY|nr:ferritin [Corynebacterium aquilae]APT85360.1 ferritin [Corynebacterium aquilae DSM 44791]